MGRVKAIIIQENAEDLLKMTRTVANPLAQARLRAFYLYKTQQYQDYESLAQQVGYERHAVGRWFRRYAQHGLAACLQPPNRGKSRKPKVRGAVLEALRQKLVRPRDYFTSYKQIQYWLQEQYDIRLSYGRVHNLVRYELGAKLKVVRKSNIKKDVVYEQKYKKS
ncbi:MAG: helix-turn-helix domain-containing protein [Cyclobacteriaceae bacterium]